MDLVMTLRHRLEGLAAAMHSHIDRLLLERLGIGVSQYKVLAFLDAHPQVGQRAVADHLRQTEASISRQVKLLLQKGLVERMTNPKSRREYIMALTPKGSKLTFAAQDILASYDANVFGQLDVKQQQKLSNILEQLQVQVNSTISA